jgi:hypothetical protein
LLFLAQAKAGSALEVARNDSRQALFHHRPVDQGRLAAVLHVEQIILELIRTLPVGLGSRQSTQRHHFI